MPALLTMLSMAAMSGAHSLQGIADFFKSNQKILVGLFGLKHGVPKYTGIRDFVGALDFESVNAAFLGWARSAAPLEAGDFVAMDGKSLKSTVSNPTSGLQDFVQVVSAFAHRTGAVVAQKRFRHKKTAEGDCVRELLGAFEGLGITLTLDALHCQKKTVERIVNTGNDYLIRVKGNQPKLLEYCQKTAQEQSPLSAHEEKGARSGRVELRQTSVFEACTSPTAQQWAGLARVVRIRRSGTRGQKPFDETCFFISSLRRSDAAHFAHGTRGHWGIENRVHWVKDVVQNEDRSRIAFGSAAENLSIFKSVAISLFRINGFNSIASATRIFANKVNELFDALAGNNLTIFRTD